MRRAIKIGVWALGLGLLGATSWAGWFLWRSRPVTSGELTVSELHQPVEISRDRWGIPHLFAANERDLFIAAGFVQAQDRLWQMELMRRLAEGRLAEVLGTEAVPTDLMMRTIGIRRAAPRAWDALAPDESAELQAYTAGVNAFIRTHRDRLPLEFRLLGYRPEEWKPVHSIYPQLLAAYLYAHNLNEELFFLRAAAKVGNRLAAELVPTVGRQVDPAEIAALPDYRGNRYANSAVPTFPPLWPGIGTGAGASNAWVVDGTRSMTGMPILAVDAHTYLYIPSIVYEMALHGGGLDVIGYFAAGSPYAFHGRNTRIAWAVVAVEADLIDLYVERLSRDGSSYLDKDIFVPLERREFKIWVSTLKRTLTREARYTPRGPILNDLTRVSDAQLPYPVVPYDGEYGVSMSWVGANVDDTSVRAYSRLNRAANWREFREALRHVKGQSFHFLYADRDGNIGWQMTGHLPIRKKGSGKYPVPGWTGEYGWVGFVPYDELPYVLNPPERSLIAANHDMLPPGYPHRVSNSWFGPYRAQRIAELLSSKAQLSVADFKTMQLDWQSLVARRLQSLLAPLATDDPEVRRALAMLGRWDGVMRPESPEAALYWAILEALWVKLFRPILGDDWPHLRLAGDGHYNALEATLDNPASPLWEAATRTAGFGHDELLLRAVRSAVDTLAHLQGRDPNSWRWDAHNRLALVHQPMGYVPPFHLLFNRGPYPVGGGPNTLNVMRMDPYTRQPRIGTVFRMIVDMADPDAGVAMGSSGQSGYPLSRHYDDMLEALLRGDYHPLPLSHEAVQRRQASLLRLLP